MKRKGWSINDIPDQTGRVAVVTGANKGLGFAIAQELAHRGAHVVLAVRNCELGAAAVDQIRDRHPEASLETQYLDLASLESIRTAAANLEAQHEHIDVLINNAGMIAPERTTTADGFESQFGTNHLGHYAFTGLLLPRLNRAAGARIVTTSSLAATMWGRDMTGDPNWEHTPYDSNAVYGWSKLANQLFAFELQRHLTASGSGAISLAAHPGGAATEGVTAMMNERTPALLRPLAAPALRLLFNSPIQGASPMLRAATDPHVAGGRYFGPGGFRQAVGSPKDVSPSPLATDTNLAARLWSLSEDLTGVRYAWSDGTAAER